MKILITGIAGFIGSHLADKLINEGQEVYGIDNLITGQSRNVNPKVKKFINNTIVSYADFAEVFGISSPDVVIHCAASYKDPFKWHNDATTNVLGTINTVILSKQFNVKRFIYFQTSLCYGPPQQHPITLNHPINPNNSYAITKTAGEQFIAMSGLDFVSFRLANCYGERNLSGPVPTFYKRITNKQKCFISDTRRDFIYIEDLVGIVMKAINGTGSGIYHISTGKDISIHELFVHIAMAIKGIDPNTIEYEDLPRNPDDVYSILLDPSKTMKDFGMIPEISIGYGILKATQYYDEFGIAETFTHLKQNN